MNDKTTNEKTAPDGQTNHLAIAAVLMLVLMCCVAVAAMGY